MSAAELKAYLKRHPSPRKLTPAEKRQNDEEMLEELAICKYGLPYDTPEDKALVREIHEWERAENGGFFVVKKHYPQKWSGACVDHRGFPDPGLCAGCLVEPAWRRNLSGS